MVDPPGFEPKKKYWTTAFLPSTCFSTGSTSFVIIGVKVVVAVGFIISGTTGTNLKISEDSSSGFLKI